MKEVGRNDPCPCGSGKKYKHCHMKSDKQAKSNNKTFIIGLIILLFIIAAVANFVIDMNERGNNRTSKPDGPAPAGKVWSEEHGHYH